MRSLTKPQFSRTIILLNLLLMFGYGTARAQITLEVIHDFVASGTNPVAALVRGTDDSLYGTTRTGGAFDLGTVFKLGTDGANFTILHSFTGSANDDSFPAAGLIQGNDGSLYGTTQAGGGGQGTIGTVFKIDPNGANFTVLHSFGCVATDGCNPRAGLIQLIDGSLYGTTWRGGAFDGGTVFKLDPDGANFSLLHSFACDGDDGCNPFAGLIKASDGNLYGTTQTGGVYGVGVVYRLVFPDNAAPDTSITSGPPQLSNSTSASFNFTSPDATSTFQCSLDDAGFSGCTSPQDYTNLAGGNHTFQVRAIDPAGNFDTSPASYSWTISTSPIPDITVTPTAFDFGSVPVKDWVDQLVTVRNDGNANLILGALSLGGANANQFAKSSDGCSKKTLAPSASCTVEARFKPISAGSKTATLIIPSNDPDENPVSVSLNGSGGTGGGGGSPDVTVTPLVIDFGSIAVKTSADQIVTVRNDGTGNLTIGAISMGGANANQFAKASDGCSKKTLAAGASCTIKARFKPTSTGAKTATLMIPSNDPDENPVNVSLGGTGTP